MVDIDSGPVGHAVGIGQSRTELVPQSCPELDVAPETPDLVVGGVPANRFPSRIMCGIPQDGALTTALSAAKHEFEWNPAMGSVFWQFGHHRSPRSRE